MYRFIVSLVTGDVYYFYPDIDGSENHAHTRMKQDNNYWIRHPIYGEKYRQVLTERNARFDKLKSEGLSDENKKSSRQTRGHKATESETNSTNKNSTNEGNTEMNGSYSIRKLPNNTTELTSLKTLNKYTFPSGNRADERRILEALSADDIAHEASKSQASDSRSVREKIFDGIVVQSSQPKASKVDIHTNIRNEYRRDVERAISKDDEMLAKKRLAIAEQSLSEQTAKQLIEETKQQLLQNPLYQHANQLLTKWATEKADPILCEGLADQINQFTSTGDVVQLEEQLDKLQKAHNTNLEYEKNQIRENIKRLESQLGIEQSKVEGE